MMIDKYLFISQHASFPEALLLDVFITLVKTSRQNVICHQMSVFSSLLSSREKLVGIKNSFR